MDGMSKIILLIIAFQVVMGLFAKRKARQKAEAEAGEPEEDLLEAEEAADPRALREREARAQARRDAAKAEAIRQQARREAEHAEAKRTRLEALKREQKAESAKSDRWGEHGGNEHGEHERAGNAPAKPAQGRKPQGQAAQLGKDLLTQIAKELGLDLPPPQHPKPVPKPAVPPSPQGAKKPAPHAVMPSAAHAQRKPSSHEPESSARRPARGIAPILEAPSAASAGSLARESMLDMESLRRAIILKTILDKPLSLRPRMPGGPGID